MAEHPIGEMMNGVMEKIRTMVDSNTVVGEPIVTPDGVTLIPVSRLSYGFASGGNDGASGGGKGSVWGGSGAAVKVDPIGFLLINDGTVRMVGIAAPPMSTTDRVIDMVPEVLDRVEGYVDKFTVSKKAGKESKSES